MNWEEVNLKLSEREYEKSISKEDFLIKRLGMPVGKTIEYGEVINVIETLYEDVEKANCSELNIEVDGKLLHSDIGYAMTGWRWFVDLLLDRLNERMKKDSDETRELWEND